MYKIEKCQKVKVDQGFFYLGPSNKERSVGYLELNPKTSLTLHNRTTGIEKLTQVKEICSMIIYDLEEGRIIKLNEKDELEIKPVGTWHIHCNPYDKISLTHWDFDGDIRNIIEAIRRSN